jgi:hypothetical protein
MGLTTLALGLAACPGDNHPITPEPVADYGIDLRYVGAVPQSVQASMNAAVSRWRQVIKGDIADSRVTVAPGQCFPGSPAMDETIDDLVVFVEFVPLSGFTGFTNLCIVRSQGGLPAIARIRINSADVPRMFNEGWGDNLILHELGHAVGLLESVWAGRQLLDLSNPTDPRFTGAAAIAAFHSLIDAQPPGSAVPLENTGPPGTIRTHWRRSVFDGEVMIPFVNPTSVISSLTVGALRDLGYEVDPGSAQRFRGRLSIGSADMIGAPVGDDAAGPIGSVDTNGKVTWFRE